MEIVANYLIGIEMAPMSPQMAMGADVIHLEADIHATADNVYGYPDGGWVPYLTIEYTLEKAGRELEIVRHAEADDREGRAALRGQREDERARQYHVTYRLSPPVANGFLRHTDQETGVPDWWKPFSVDFRFKYPQE